MPDIHSMLDDVTASASSSTSSLMEDNGSEPKPTTMTILQQQQQQYQLMQQQQQQQSNQMEDTNSATLEDTPMLDSSSTPAGPLARSLSIPIFPTQSSSNAGSSYSTPSKRNKFTPAASSGAGTPPTTNSSAMEMMMQQSAAQAQQQAAQTIATGVGMSPGTYYRKAAAATTTTTTTTSSSANSSPIASPTSLQKRRNSHTPSLNLSPNQAPATSHVTSAASATSVTSTSSIQPRAMSKPPVYSGPSTPSMVSRTAPVNIGSGSKSATHMGSGSNHGLSMTPPATPPMLPMPRAMLPNNPLTPALAPERSISVATSYGVVKVTSKDMGQHMDSVEEVMLPPQAAPDRASKASRVRTMSSQAQAQASPTASSVVAPEPVTSPVLSPIVPVKHLVKLSSLSSLSSLIAPATTASTTTAGPMSPTASPGSAPIVPNISPSPVSLRADSPLSGGRTLPTPVPSLPPTYIILDIDETIHVNAHSPCLMMCEKGLEMYQKIISTHQNYRNVAYATKSSLTKTLQTALQSKRTVESQTSDLLNSLQLANPAQNNIKIFGLTARFSHMASTTRKELLKLNIDLEKSSPFPMTVRKKMALAAGWTPGQQADKGSPQQSPQNAQDRSLTPSPILSAAITPLSSSPMGAFSLPAASSPTAPPAEYWPDVSWTDHASHGTDAKYSQGVIYTNACEKGPVLQRFLQFLWNKIEEDNHEVHEQNEALKRQLAAAQLASAKEMAMEDDSSSNHAISSPITIGGGASSTSSSMMHSSPPSPPEANMTLLAAASKLAQRKSTPTGQASPSPVHGVHAKGRRDSKHGDHLTLPGHPTVDPSTPMSPVGSEHSYPTFNPISHLPSRLIFIDDRLQNCFSVYESLSAASLFDRYYNDMTRRAKHQHVPGGLEIYTCHYVPVELQHHGPTNQTKADAAATAAANGGSAPGESSVDLELIETQIHHFLTHGEILSDPKGREMVQFIRGEREQQVRQQQQPQQPPQQTSAAVAPAPVTPPTTTTTASSSSSDVMMEDDSSTASSGASQSTPMQDTSMTPRHAVTVQ